MTIADTIFCKADLIPKNIEKKNILKNMNNDHNTW